MVPEGSSIKIWILIGGLMLSCSPPLERILEEAESDAADSTAVSTERLPCTYLPRRIGEVELPGHEDHLDAGHQPEINTFTDCAVRIDGSIQVDQRHLAALDYDSDGLASMLIADEWHYVRADGTTAAVISWDNGPDAFSGGFARSRIENKIAYINRSLQVVLPPIHDWGWPFQDGAALVCRGCRFERAPGEEHTSVVGGVWGYIDASGQELIPVKYSRDEARSALAKLRG